MTAINFNKQFANRLVSGEKSCTIRKPRQNPINCGDRLRLYTGHRTKHCRKLAEAECTGIQPIIITNEGVWVDGKRDDNIYLLDGFASQEAFKNFFRETYGSLPFEGILIHFKVISKNTNNQ